MEILDIKKEGFTIKHIPEDSNPNVIYTIDIQNQREPSYPWIRDVIYNNRNNWLLIIDGDNETPYEDWKTRFSGYVETQEDFKKLLTQLP